MLKFLNKLNRPRVILCGLGLAFAGAGGTAFAISLPTVKASGLELHPPAFPWSHGGMINSLDHASIRRGYFVYKQVCQACHSMEFATWRRLIGVCMTFEEAKAEAAEYEIEDGPNDDGEMFMRPRIFSDPFPNPYANDIQAKMANNGAEPPDLSLIVNAREGGEDYIFSLLTGYCDPPEGVELDEGQSYNPYFKSGAKLSMAQQLFPGSVEYDDGTPATVSQMAKDVCTFLKWSSQCWYDQSRRTFIKAVLFSLLLFPAMFYYKRLIWAPLKTRQIAFKPGTRPRASQKKR